MARLPQGVRRRSDGLLEKRFTINHNRYSVYAGSKQELEEKEKEIREQIEKGTYKKNSNITLNEYFSRWLEYKQLDTKGNSLKTYKSIYYNHLSDKLGKCKIKNLEVGQLKELQIKLSKEYCVSTCNYIFTVLKMILNDSVKEKIIASNPVNDIKSLKDIKADKKAAETYHRALTEKEQELFMQEIKNNYYYELFALALCTGMRFGELCALTWGDIDYNNNVIHVTETQTFDIDGNVTKGTPKTAKGIRDIPLTPNARQILKSQREKLGNIYSIDFKSDPVFVSVYGKTIYNSRINKEISKALDQIKKQGHEIEHFTIHALRDTFATRYIEQGGQPQTLKAILGHSSLAMTMDLYAHVLPNTMQDEMQRIVINI